MVQDIKDTAHKFGYVPMVSFKELVKRDNNNNIYCLLGTLYESGTLLSPSYVLPEGVLIQTPKEVSWISHKKELRASPQRKVKASVLGK